VCFPVDHVIGIVIWSSTSKLETREIVIYPGLYLSPFRTNIIKNSSGTNTINQFLVVSISNSLRKNEITTESKIDVRIIDRVVEFSNSCTFFACPIVDRNLFDLSKLEHHFAKCVL